ncbi:MAG: helix-turn-helix domain-containing protein [Chloroflexi bacterium]|nr:helix-turn-helix domain-containing protein [Chloroflexota bacterium]
MHPETIKRLCRNGELPAAKFGNAWLILRKDLDEFARTYVPRRGARSKINY